MLLSLLIVLILLLFVVFMITLLSTLTHNFSPISNSHTFSNSNGTAFSLKW